MTVASVHCPSRGQGEAMNYNVRIALLFTVCFYIAQSIATQGVFSAYVYLLTDGSTSKVGYLTGLSGLAQVIAAPVFAYLADKHRRDRLLSVAGVLSILVSAGLALGIYEGQYSLLCVALIGTGICNGAQNPAMEALFADSVEAGKRSQIFTTKYVLLQVAYAGGPLCCVFMFHFLGNEWAMEDTQAVIYFGLALSVLPSFLCFLFDDDRAIGGARGRSRHNSRSSTTDVSSSYASNCTENSGDTVASLRQPLLRLDEGEVVRGNRGRVGGMTRTGFSQGLVTRMSYEELCKLAEDDVARRMSMSMTMGGMGVTQDAGGMQHLGHMTAFAGVNLGQTIVDEGEEEGETGPLIARTAPPASPPDPPHLGPPHDSTAVSELQDTGTSYGGSTVYSSTGGSGVTRSTAMTDTLSSVTASGRARRLWRLCCKYYVPVTIAFTDVLFGLASGMSVRFFPLFFMNDCHLSPMAVNLVYVASPLATSASSFLAQRASRKFGRIHVTILCKVVGVGLLYLLCYLSMRAQRAPSIVLVLVWILRTAIMNSTKPLTRSVIMDSAPRRYRAQWNAVESVTMATWSGSAVIGGILVDHYGTGINNIITASLQLVSTLPLLMVAHLVPREQDQTKRGAEEVVTLSDTAPAESPRAVEAMVAVDPDWRSVWQGAVAEDDGV